jgi:hypothetical protein
MIGLMEDPPLPEDLDAPCRQALSGRKEEEYWNDGSIPLLHHPSFVVRLASGVSLNWYLS